MAYFPSSGGSSLTNPHVIYARTDGNDTTGDGTPAKPYLTAQKAYDTGVTAAVPFVIDLGVGAFTITLTADWSTYAKAVRGAGFELSYANSPTTLDITAKPATQVNAPGLGAYNIGNATVSGALEASNLCIVIDASGGNVTANDASNSYTAGNGSTVTLTGHASFGLSVAGGGDTNSADSLIGGGGGIFYLYGPLILASDKSLSCATGIGVNGGGNDGDGSGNADGCDIRGAATTGTITLGRCSYTAGLTVTDKGGNAVY
jgi:hypothetical protein